MDSKIWTKEFERLILPMLDSLYSMALRLTGENGWAEDLVQETILRAHRKFDRFDKGTLFRPWIFTVLTHIFINDYRRLKRERTRYNLIEDEPCHLPRAGTLFTPHDVEALRNALSDEVAECLDEVPADNRLVFLLWAFGNFRYKEIAEIVGAPIGTVMSRLFRSREMLRDRLADYARESGFLREELNA